MHSENVYMRIQDPIVTRRLNTLVGNTGLYDRRPQSRKV